MPMANVCLQKYVNSTLVSRLCVQGNIDDLEDEYHEDEGYVLSEVGSCDLCPTYPPGPIDREDLKRIVREILRELEEESRR
jgi:hypothetical protein